ncbi:MAG: hypothetical protein ABEK59_12485, partial [Halobacteria archaeon]
STAKEPVIDGLGRVNFVVEEEIDLIDYYDTNNSQPKYEPNALTVDLTTDAINLSSGGTITAGAIKRLKLDKNLIDTAGNTAQLTILKDVAKPGLGLQDTNDNLSTGLTILTYPFEQQGKVQMFVKNDTGSDITLPSTSPNELNLYVYTADDSQPSSGDLIFVVKGTVDSDEIGSLDSAFYTEKINDAHFFIPVHKGSTSWHKSKLLKENTDPDYQEVDIGVPIRFGSIGDTDFSFNDIYGGDFDTLSSDYFLQPGSNFFVRFYSTKVTVGAGQDGSNVDGAFEKGKDASEIIRELEDAVATHPQMLELLDNIEVQSALLPPQLVFESSFSGLEAQRIKFKAIRNITSGSPTDINYEDSNGNDLFDTWQQLKGAENGQRDARRYFYDRVGNEILMVRALSAGERGNNINVSITPLQEGQFTISVSYNDNLGQLVDLPDETYTLDNENIDLQTGLYLTTASSNLIRAYFLPVYNTGGRVQLSEKDYDALPARLAPPNGRVTNTSDIRHPSFSGADVLQNISLLGGYTPTDTDGRLPSKDYEAAVRRLEDTDVAFIALTGFDAEDWKYRDVLTRALSQAEQSSPFNGLRSVVIAAPPRLTKNRATRISKLFNSDRLVIVGGWNTFFGTRQLGVNSVSPVGYYVGKTAETPPQISPAAAGRVAGVLTNELKARPDFLDHLTRVGIEALYYDNSKRGYK